MKNMMKMLGLVILITGGMLSTNGQLGSLPITEWKSVGAGKFVFYISGDGGMNKFSKDVCQSFQKNGYSVSAMDASNYFAKSKTPEQTAAAIANYISNQMNSHHYVQLFMTGYSLGADVLPFIVTRFPEYIKGSFHKIILVSPSTTTDFEIHLADQLGVHTVGKMNVITEINKLTPYQVYIFSGTGEDVFPVQQVNLKSFYFEKLPGGHHYDDKPLVLSAAMMEVMK
jgi:type IV secretory pathway VirJ component